MRMGQVALVVIAGIIIVVASHLDISLQLIWRLDIHRFRLQTTDLQYVAVTLKEWEDTRIIVPTMTVDRSAVIMKDNNEPISFNK